VGLAAPAVAALRRERLDEAVEALARATREGQVAAAVLHVVQRETSFTRSFGKARSDDAMFLLGSISKPISVTALMTLFDRGEFKLGDPLKKFIPQFAGDRRDQVTMQHLLTHVSGLPDQLAENKELRSKHASLSEFVAHAIPAQLHFVPGSRYQYSSMAAVHQHLVLIKEIPTLEPEGSDTKLRARVYSAVHESFPSMQNTIGKTTLRLVTGDIADEDTDAVVTAAHWRLNKGVGTDGTIHGKGDHA